MTDAFELELPVSQLKLSLGGVLFTASFDDTSTSLLQEVYINIYSKILSSKLSKAEKTTIEQAILKTVDAPHAQDMLDQHKNNYLRLAAICTAIYSRYIVEQTKFTTQLQEASGQQAVLDTMKQSIQELITSDNLEKIMKGIKSDESPSAPTA